MKTLNEAISKRILVAIDTSPNSLASLEVAVDLAEYMQAQLETLFIQDSALLHLASLPFATELDRVSGEARALNEPEITEALKAQERRLNKQVNTYCKQRQINSGLRTVRGNYINEAMQAQADILFMFSSSLSSFTPLKVVNTKRGWHSTFCQVAPIYVYFKDDSGSELALLLACHLAKALGSEMIVLLPKEKNKATNARVNQVEKLVEKSIMVRYEIIDADLSTFVRSMGTSACSLLVVQKNDAQEQLLETNLIQLVPCPLVLVS